MTRLEYAIAAAAIIFLAVVVSGCAPARLVTHCAAHPASCN